MRKVRVIMQNLKFGGAEKTLCTFLNNFDRNRYTVELILHTKEGALLSEVPDDVKVRGIVPRDNGHIFNKMCRALFFRLLLFSPGVCRLFFKIMYHQADLTIAYMEGISTNIAACFSGPRISWVHTNVCANPWADSFFLSKSNQENIYKKMDRIVFVSEDGKKMFRQKFPKIKASREFVIHNPVDGNLIRKQSVIMDIDFNEWKQKTRETFKLVVVGRLDAIKRIDIIIGSYLRLAQKSSEFSLTIIGDGAERSRLEKLSISTPGVFFLGFKKNPLVYVKNSDLFISTSKVESYPTAIIESLIVQTPVIATRNGGTLEVFGDGRIGLLNPDIEASQLEYEILKSKNSPTLMMRQVKELSKSFSINNVLTQYYRMFEEVLQN